MKKTTTLFLVFAIAVITGCENKQRIVSTSFDTFVLPKPRANLQKVIVNNKPLVSDQVLPKTKPQIALVPPINEPPDLLPIVKLIVVDLDSQVLFAYGDENQGNELRSYFISGALGPDLPIDAKGEATNKPHNHLGNYSILDKDFDHFSGVYNCPMPYALHYFQGHYIHMTEPKFYHQIGQPASHGCIREKEQDAIWLYSHSRVGTKVIIERSGSGPTELVSKF